MAAKAHDAAVLCPVAAMRTTPFQGEQGEQSGDGASSGPSPRHLVG